MLTGKTASSFMLILPKGTPLAENVPTSRIDLPVVLGKLRNSNFNGYAKFGLSAATGVFLYIEGRLISVFFQPEGNNSRQDLDAIQATIENLVLNRDGDFSAYRFSKEIAFALLAMFRGELILNAQEMKLIDFKAVLEKIKAERMNACLKIYTENRAGLILYRDGAPIGFCHDSAQEIGLSQADIQKIAVLPGARIDVRVIKDSEDGATLVDLNDLVDIAKAWSVAKKNVFTTVSAAPVASPSTAISAEPPKTDLAGLQSGLSEVAFNYLGKLGRPLLEKELAKIGGVEGILVPGKLEELLAGLENGSKLLTNLAKIRQMQDAMRDEVARYR